MAHFPQRPAQVQRIYNEDPVDTPQSTPERRVEDSIYDTDPEEYADLEDNQILSAFNPELDDEEDSSEREDGAQEEEEPGEEEDEEGEEEEVDEETDVSEEEEGSETAEGKGKEESESAEQSELLDRELTYKVDGEERKTTVRELRTQAQKAEAAQKRMISASRTRKQAESIIEAVKRDPLGAAYAIIAQEAGDETAHQHVLNAARRVLGKELEWQSLPDEERQRIQYEQALERQRKENQRLREKEESATREQRNEAIRQSLRQAAVEAGFTSNPEHLKSQTGLEILRKIAVQYDHARDVLGEEITYAEAARRAKQEHVESMRQYVATLPEGEQRALGFDPATLRANGAKRPPKVRASTAPTRGKKRPKRPQPSEGGEPRKPFFRSYKEAQKAAQRGIRAGR